MQVDKEFSSSRESLASQLGAISTEANSNRLLLLSSVTKELNQVMSQTVVSAHPAARRHPKAAERPRTPLPRAARVPGNPRRHGQAHALPRTRPRQLSLQPLPRTQATPRLHVPQRVHPDQALRKARPATRGESAAQEVGGQAFPGVATGQVPREVEPTAARLHEGVRAADRRAQETYG